MNYEILSTADLANEFESIVDNALTFLPEKEYQIILAVAHRLETLEKIEKLLE